MQLSVRHFLLKSLTSITLWFVMTFLRNVEDFVSENSLKKWVSMRTPLLR